MRRFLTAVTLLALVAAVSPTTAQIPTRLKLVFATPPTTYALPHFVAQDLGWLKQRGLEVEEVWLTGDANALRALLSGQGDIAAPGTFPVYSVLAEGGRIKAIGSWQPLVDDVLIAREGITALKELAGARVAAASVGGLTTEFLEYALDPFINALYAIPRVALVPLIILWAGLEGRGKVTILVSVAIFPVIINTYAGIKDVRGSLLEIGRAYGATERQIFTKIVLPAAVPYIMAGVRLSVGLAIIGMIVAEFFTAITGLGGLIVVYANSFATAKLFVPIIVVGLLGVGLTSS